MPWNSRQPADRIGNARNLLRQLHRRIGFAVDRELDRMRDPGAPLRVDRLDAEDQAVDPFAVGRRQKRVHGVIPVTSVVTSGEGAARRASIRITRAMYGTLMR